MEQLISNELQSIGMSPQYPGFHYVKDAILLCLNDLNYLFNINQRLYPILGEKYNKHPTSVERSIRYAISLSQRDLSNKKFIGEMVEKLKYIDKIQNK